MGTFEGNDSEKSCKLALKKLAGIKSISFELYVPSGLLILSYWSSPFIVMNL